MKAKKNPVVDIGRNSSIYFAIGLNIMLFFTWQALEIKTYEVDQDLVEIINMEKQYEEEIPIVNVNTPPPPPPPASVQESIKIIEDVVEIEETVIESSEIGLEDAIVAPIPVAVEAVEVEEVEEDVQVPFAVIEHVPVFPGCEQGSNQEKIACFQEKMKAHISKHFKYPQAALDLGTQGRVSVVFIIDTTGKISSIKSRGPDKILEKEAERIISLLPNMTPGKQRGKPVKVSYAVPIFFKFEER
ncbi:energy transducer TonB [Tamlana sp. 2_MG-2023]|uniref:energy transducer TonB n=1 Tax=unclassified Tamlana TaxID=2614803 RepID=UPI0026E1F6B5|nr:MULTISPECIES: energy transducer TonB [unclassified Tamlana]MDO6758665.1 energy transducer TonB [Tamlana sp. 2_MG-2023]MDO6789364.1 energy transducer TonB [Tamlana sp. 1_MG-2023]